MTRREKMRRRKRMFWRIRQTIFIIACLLIVFAIGNTAYNFIRFHDSTEAEKQVLQNKKDYPDELIDFMKHNKEADEFVANYTKYHDKHFKISLAGEYKEDSIPYFLQWDKRWGYETFDGTYFGISGSAPTCISMISVGLSGDLAANPLVVGSYIESNNYISKEHKIDSKLMTDGVSYFDLVGTPQTVNENKMTQLLKKGHPMIAKVKTPVFLEREHYIVIYSTDKSGKFLIYDPNSKLDTHSTYTFEELKEEIDALWSYTLV